MPLPVLTRSFLCRRLRFPEIERMQREYEDRRKDPDDVLIAAANRKREIRQQISALQKAVKRRRKKAFAADERE